jgi:hypothetical protein
MKGFALATAIRRDHICKVCLDRQGMAGTLARARFHPADLNLGLSITW